MAALCRSCRAAVIWTVTAPKGKAKPRRMPVDARPVAGGNIVLLDGGRQPTAVYVDPASPSLDGAPRYVSHFATCPDAAGHRRG